MRRTGTEPLTRVRPAWSTWTLNVAPERFDPVVKAFQRCIQLIAVCDELERERAVVALAPVTPRSRRRRLVRGHRAKTSRALRRSRMDSVSRTTTSTDARTPARTAAERSVVARLTASSGGIDPLARAALSRRAPA